jgi:DNA-binding beta-propeller fold protein YncE
MIRPVSRGLGSGARRAWGPAVVAVLLGCVGCAATASAASTASATPSETHLSIVAGTGAAGAPTPGPAVSSALYHPRGAAVSPTTGDLYIADYHNSEVEQVTPLDTLSVVAGTGSYGAPAPGPATKSPLGNPTGVALDTSGDLYIADAFNNEVEKVTPQGTLSIVAGTGAAGAPTPGPATQSKLDEPYGVALDSANGDLYIADYGNSQVEKVTPHGTLSIVAGTGGYGTPTPGPATTSALRNPGDVAVDSTTGNLYIADPFNNEVEQVTRPGILSIVAGTGAAGAPTPGPATQSALNLPHGVAVNSTGDLYIADYNNSEVEKVTPQGTLSIVAGTGAAGAPTPGPATQSALDDPLGVGVDPGTGDLYIADTDSNEVERVGPACPAPSGGLTGVRLGPVALGMTRAQTRRALPILGLARNQLDLCLAGGPGILVGYPATRLLRTLSARQRAQLRGRVVLALTANHHYAFDGITAGTRVSRVHGRLAHASRLRIGDKTWYVLLGSEATKVLDVQHGTVEEVGIANQALTTTRAEQRRLLAGF